MKIVLSPSVLKREKGSIQNYCYFFKDWGKESFSVSKQTVKVQFFIERAKKNNVFHLWGTSNCQLLVIPTSKTNSYFYI